MPRLSTYSTIWILMLLFDLTVTENKLYPNLQKKRVTHDRDSSKKFWKRRLLYKNEVIEAVGSLMNETSQLVNKNINFDGKLGNVMENTKGQTLIDYIGPAIIGEDLDNKSDKDFADHVRVKRNEPTNDSIINHQLNHSVNIFDSFPSNFWSNTDAVNVHSHSVSEFEGYENSDHIYRNRFDLDTTTIRHEKAVLSKNKQHGKRMKRNIRYSKHQVETKDKKKKHNMLKSSRKPAVKKANNYKKTSKKTSKKTEVVSTKMMGESRIEKRESGKDSLNTDLAKTNITDYDKRKEDAVVLPFVHTGRAELRVRIEKIPKNESLLINNWTDHTIETSTCCSTTLSKYDDEILANTTDFQFVPSFDSIGSEKVNNLTVEIIVKKLDYGNNVSNNCGASDSGNASFYNTGSYPMRSDLSRIEADRELESGKYNRAKRNQEIMSRHLQGDRNTLISSKHFNEQGLSVKDTKPKKKHKSRGNRAVRSIEEIKELAEKLIIKVNELQMYVSERNETQYTTNICVDKDTNGVAIEETPSISSKKKHFSGTKISKPEIANNRRHFARNSRRVTLTEKGASSLSRMPFSGARFARGENPIQGIKSRRKWGRWMDWSSCSVTCGKGRQIRWRHCLRDCNDAETEMEEKACQLPACPPGKFLGIF